MSFYPELRRSTRGARTVVNGAHANLEFGLVISGRATYFFKDRQSDLVPGTLQWVLPGEYHQLLRSPDFEMWVAIIDPSQFDESFLNDVAANPCRLLSSEDALALDRLMSHVSQDSDQPAVFRAGADYVFRSAWHATMSSPGPSRKALHPAVVQALEILRSEASDLPSAELAHRCGVTQGYLGQICMEQTGRGLVEWRNRFRIERFVVAYSGSHDLLTAAFDAGFGSYTQFHRVFSDLIGSTPGEWAKSGSELSLGSLSSVGGLIRGSNAEGQRMIWYPLSELALPAAARWFTPGFDRALRQPSAGATEAPLLSGIESWDDMRRHEAALLEDAASASPALAEALGRAFARMDVFELCRDALGSYATDINDLAAITTLYVGLAWFCVQSAPTPSQMEVAALATRIRVALKASGSFAGASETERQIAASALVAQSIFLRSAIEAARSSGNHRTVERIRTAAHAACLSTTGVDVKSIDLMALLA